ncbi:uncharacterized protein LOC134539309 [Bacillus rossius redtenbacheri]|uniref:uncharacterized protein LOC134539309 n=1 Tax=Bacillus rossius redtenbacheri TaxID=93214 RepID=UPI002FDCD8CA
MPRLGHVGAGAKTLGVALCALLLGGAGASRCELEEPGTGDGQKGRANHRVKLLFPLLIAISVRLGALVPMVGSLLALLLALVVFAKKALLVSLATLGVVLVDKLRAAPAQRPTQPPRHEHVLLRPGSDFHSEKEYRNSVQYGDSDDEDYS